MLGANHDDMVFMPRLDTRQRGKNAQKLSEARSLNTGRKSVWYRIGRKFAVYKAAQNDALIKHYGKSSQLGPGPRAGALRKVIGRGSIVGLIAEAAMFIAEAGTTGYMAYKSMNGAGTFEMQAQKFNRFLFGDKPAKARAAVLTRNHILRNPMLMGMIEMGQVDDVHARTRHFYEHSLEMEKAFDDVREKVPGQMTTLEKLIYESSDKMRKWWATYSKDNPEFRKVVEAKMRTTPVSLSRLGRIM